MLVLEPRKSAVFWAAAFLFVGGTVAIVLSGCGKPAAGHFDQPERASFGWSVTDAFGPLVVRAGQFDVETPTKPWSSWWYPVSDPYLFKGTNGQPGPLQKYDAYSADYRRSETHAASYEATKLYDPDAASWEGLCNAWAAASILEPEPTKGVTIGSTYFAVGDLKALLVKSYEYVDNLRQYGQRFNGDRQSVFEDIYPDQFHRFLQAQLFERKRPFILDKDPGVAVWNTPVWKASLQVQQDAADPGIMHVDTWLFGASPFVSSYDYVGTLSVAFEYTYDLYGYPQEDGSFHVMYGVWTGRSVDWHPDFVTEITKGGAHHSKNEELDTAVVEDIVHAALGSR